MPLSPSLGRRLRRAPPTGPYRYNPMPLSPPLITTNPSGRAPSPIRPPSGLLSSLHDASIPLGPTITGYPIILPRYLEPQPNHEPTGASTDTGPSTQAPRHSTPPTGFKRRCGLYVCLLYALGMGTSGLYVWPGTRVHGVVGATGRPWSTPLHPLCTLTTGSGRIPPGSLILHWQLPFISRISYRLLK